MDLSYVYILNCSDNTFYTGVTTNLQQRIQEHNQGKHANSYTASRLPVDLVFFCSFTEVGIAIQFEKKIKKWSRAKKMALIENRYEDLPNLTKKVFRK